MAAMLFVSVWVNPFIFSNAALNMGRAISGFA
jgi:hypothetical protein